VRSPPLRSENDCEGSPRARGSPFPGDPSPPSYFMAVAPPLSPKRRSKKRYPLAEEMALQDLFSFPGTSLASPSLLRNFLERFIESLVPLCYRAAFFGAPSLEPSFFLPHLDGITSWKGSPLIAVKRATFRKTHENVPYPDTPLFLCACRESFELKKSLFLKEACLSFPPVIFECFCTLPLNDFFGVFVFFSFFFFFFFFVFPPRML